MTVRRSTGVHTIPVGMYALWARSLAQQESRALRAYARLGPIPSCQPLRLDIEDFHRWHATRIREQYRRTR